MSFRKLLLVLVLPVISFTTFIGCDEEDNPANTPATPKANVIVIHASPDAPKVDILIDNVKKVSGLAFPNNTGYVALDAKITNVKVNVENTTTTVIEADLPLVANKNYSVFATDSVSKLTPIVFEDDLTAPASGKAHVRFIHLSPGAPNVNITLTDGTKVFEDVEFKENTGFSPLNGGTYNLQVRDAATNGTVILELPNITLQSGKIYTVFAKGFPTGTGTQALGAEIIVNK
ncbi:MAG: DUF4397 domain-containing protein [Ignavibacteriaceae bacterium]|jgi:hypothetical protein|nr:DUF4397 domain-containing protein [Ignavibacteriaceae bacterium]